MLIHKNFTFFFFLLKPLTLNYQNYYITLHQKYNNSDSQNRYIILYILYQSELLYYCIKNVTWIFTELISTFSKFSRIFYEYSLIWAISFLIQQSANVIAAKSTTMRHTPGHQFLDRCMVKLAHAFHARRRPVDSATHVHRPASSCFCARETKING